MKSTSFDVALGVLSRLVPTASILGAAFVVLGLVAPFASVALGAAGDRTAVDDIAVGQRSDACTVYIRALEMGRGDMAHGELYCRPGFRIVGFWGRVEVYEFVATPIDWSGNLRWDPFVAASTYVQWNHQANKVNYRRSETRSLAMNAGMFTCIMRTCSRNFDAKITYAAWVSSQDYSQTVLVTCRSLLTTWDHQDGAVREVPAPGCPKP